MPLTFFISNLFREGTKESFGRALAVPFLFSSWLLLTIGGWMEMLANSSAPLETAATLSVTGIGLYSGSKYLSLKGAANTDTPPSVLPEAVPVRPSVPVPIKPTAPRPASVEMLKDEDAA